MNDARKTKAQLLAELAELRRRLALAEVAASAASAAGSDSPDPLQIQATLVAEHSNLLALLENTPDRIWAIDRDYRLIYGNSIFTQATLPFLQRSLQPGDNVLIDAYPSEALAEWRSYYNRALNGEAFRVELPTQFAPVVRWMEYLFQPIRLPDGQITGVTVLGHDLTERQQHERLRRLIENITALFFATPTSSDLFPAIARLISRHLAMPTVAVELYDEALDEMTIIGSNEADAARLQLRSIPASRTISGTVAHTRQPVIETQAGARADYADTVLRTLNVQTFVCVPILAGRSVLGALSAADPVSRADAAELLEPLQAIARHLALIIEHQRGEERLRASERRFRTLIEYLPVAAAFRDGDDMTMNLACEQLLGYARRELPTVDRWLDALFGVRSDEVRRAYEADRAAGFPTPREVEVITRSGQRRPIEWSGCTVGRFEIWVLADLSRRRQAEEALRQSEERYRWIAETVSDMAYAVQVAPDGTLQPQWITPAVARLAGITEAEMLKPDGWRKITHPDDWPIVQHQIDELRANRACTVQYRLVDRAGNIHWVIDRARPVWDAAQGQVTAFYGAVQDITDQHAAENRYRLLFQEMLDGFALHEIICDSDGHPIDYRFLEVNRAFEQLTGLRAADVIGRTVLTVMPDTEPYWIQTYGQVALTGQPVVMANYSQALNKHFLVTAFCPQPGQFAVIFADVTEQQRHTRQLEAIAAISAALRAAHTRDEMLPIIVDQTQALLQADGVVIDLQDPASGEVTAAAARGAWTGWLGRRLQPASSLTHHVIASEQPYRNEDVTRDPRVIHPELYGQATSVGCAPLVVEQHAVGALWIGRAGGRAVTSADLQLLIAIAEIAATALARAAVLDTLEQRVLDRTHDLAAAIARLSDLDRLKSKFVADVSHELRGPVTSLNLYVDLMETGKPEKRDHYFQALKMQTARLHSLVNDILDLSRLEQTGPAQIEPFDLNTLVEGVMLAHQPRAEAAGQSLHFEGAPDLPPVWGDARAMSQAIVNLLINAMNYSPAGVIVLRTFTDGRRLGFEVGDNGPGIDPADLPHLFERFYRGKNAAQSRLPGTGLGLSIVKEIVDAHGGQVEASSRPGDGTTFRVWLPLSTPA